MNLFLAQTRPPVSQANAMLITIVLMFFIMYLLIIRPQKQRQTEHQKMIQALKKNDDVITIGGIYGTVLNVKDKTVVLRIADNVKIEIQKSAIAGLKKDKPDVSALAEGEPYVQKP